MPAVARIGDIGSGHDCCPDSAAISGDSSVEINGIPVVCVGDEFAPHDCRKCEPHDRVLVGGSSSVFVNGKAVGRVGDAIGCGGAIASGSSDVEIG